LGLCDYKKVQVMRYKQDGFSVKPYVPCQRR
jgi:hypothetical protein